MYCSRIHSHIFHRFSTVISLKIKDELNKSHHLMQDTPYRRSEAQTVRPDTKPSSPDPVK
jgi:hypothetical protein